MAPDGSSGVEGLLLGVGCASGAGWHGSTSKAACAAGGGAAGLGSGAGVGVATVGDSTNGFGSAVGMTGSGGGATGFGAGMGAAAATGFFAITFWAAGLRAGDLAALTFPAGALAGARFAAVLLADFFAADFFVVFFAGATFFFPFVAFFALFAMIALPIAAADIPMRSATFAGRSHLSFAPARASRQRRVRPALKCFPPVSIHPPTRGTALLSANSSLEGRVRERSWLSRST
jgi:hypothetical protein